MNSNSNAPVEILSASELNDLREEMARDYRWMRLQLALQNSRSQPSHGGSVPPAVRAVEGHRELIFFANSEKS